VFVVQPTGALAERRLTTAELGVDAVACRPRGRV